MQPRLAGRLQKPKQHGNTEPVAQKSSAPGPRLPKSPCQKTKFLVKSIVSRSSSGLFLTSLPARTPSHHFVKFHFQRLISDYSSFEAIYQGVFPVITRQNMAFVNCSSGIPDEKCQQESFHKASFLPLTSNLYGKKISIC